MEGKSGFMGKKGAEGKHEHMGEMHVHHHHHSNEIHHHHHKEGEKKEGHEKKHEGKSMKLGGGGQFKAGVAKIEKKEGLGKKAAGAIMAKAGDKKYGKGKMEKMAHAGKERAKKA